MASPVSPPDSMSSPTQEFPEAGDHYAILEITPRATTDEVKAAYRRLRVVYFSSDAKKYRALQAAFDVLMDPQSREAYDATYQPAAAPPVSLASIGEILDSGKLWRQDSAHGDDPVIPEEDEDDDEQVRTDDPNWGLKRYHFVHEPVLGSMPYMSYIPLPNYSLPLCGTPRYTGEFAINALPN